MKVYVFTTKANTNTTKNLTTNVLIYILYFIFFNPALSDTASFWVMMLPKKHHYPKRAVSAGDSHGKA